jgi:hypothetical protein
VTDERREAVADAASAPGAHRVARMAMAANRPDQPSAEPWEAVADASYDRLEEIAKRLLQMPRFLAVLSDLKRAPDMMIQCPKRHSLFEVTLDMDQDRNPYLVATSREDNGVVTNGWESLGLGSVSAAESIRQNRVRFKCPRCPYDGVWTQGDLLSLYAAALQKGKTHIRLFA